jgi:ABC-type branched-subunit amino acid transport system substrate-binding protein
MKVTLIAIALVISGLSIPLDSTWGQSFLSQTIVIDNAPMLEKPDYLDDERLSVEESAINNVPSISADDTLESAVEESGYPEMVTDRNESEPSAGQSLSWESLARIYQLMYEGEFGLALSRLENLEVMLFPDLKDSDDFDLMELRQYYRLRLNYHLGQFERVVELAYEYLRFFGNGRNFHRAYYYFAASLSELGRPLEYTALVTNDFFTSLSGRERRSLRQYLIEDAIAKGHLMIALDYLFTIDGEVVPGFENWIGKIVAAIDNLDDIEEILVLYYGDRLESHANLRKTQLLIRNGDYTEAQAFLKHLFEQREMEPEMQVELLELQDFVDTALNADPTRIGVVLPLSHRHFSGLAQQVLDGLELAQQQFAASGGSVQLVIKDSAEVDAVVADASMPLSQADRLDLVKKQVVDLVEQDRVIAIFGPLARNTSLAAGEMAEKYKVPVICFSKTEEIGTQLPFLFRFQQNQIQEAQLMAVYATDYLQAQRFVLFYQEDLSGKGFRLMKTFAEQIKAKGGVIAGLARIQPNQVDFRDDYLAMTGGFRSLQLSATEQEELRRIREGLEPVIDFDAMFVPVRPDQLKIITDFNRSFEADNVWVLAGSEINVKENQLLSHTARLRFIDAFPISATSTFLQPFFEAHWRAFSFRPDYQPPTDYTLFAYEAFEILARLLNDPRLHNRESLRDAIAKLNAFPVLTGKIDVHENGEITKNMSILQINSKTTVPVF